MGQPVDETIGSTICTSMQKTHQCRKRISTGCTKFIVLFVQVAVERECGLECCERRQLWTGQSKQDGDKPNEDEEKLTKK